MLNATTTVAGEHLFVAHTTKSRPDATEENASVSISPIHHCMHSLTSAFGETELDVLDEPMVSQDARERASSISFLPEIPQRHTSAYYYHYYLQHYRDAFFPLPDREVLRKGVSCNTTAENILDQSEMRYVKKRDIGSTLTSLQGLSGNLGNPQCSNLIDDYTIKGENKSMRSNSVVLPSFGTTPPENRDLRCNSAEADSATDLRTSRCLDFSHADSPLPEVRQATTCQSNRGGPLLSDQPQTAPPTYFFRRNDRSTDIKFLPKLTPPNSSSIVRLMRSPSHLKPRGLQETHCLSEHERALTDGPHNS